jgi:hypothetical protein
LGASRFCKYPQISVKWVKSKETLKKSRERAMTPEELERLECCTSEIAKILYNNTPPSELTSLENIEKHLRQQWLAHVGPKIGFFYQTGNGNRTRTTPHSKKLYW